ncbi:MAG: hypothetical protein ACRDY7_18355, partial [Acidimicrobiia bacterium]
SAGDPANGTKGAGVGGGDAGAGWRRVAPGALFEAAAFVAGVALRGVEALRGVDARLRDGWAAAGLGVAAFRVRRASAGVAALAGVADRLAVARGGVRLGLS